MLLYFPAQINWTRKITLLAFALIVFQSAVVANPVDVGRAVVTLPNHGTWTQYDALTGKVDYTGERSGYLKDETKAFALTLPNNRWGAVFVMTASRFGTDTQISWTSSCQATGKEKAIDLTQGSQSEINCLRIWDSIDTVNLFNDPVCEKAGGFKPVLLCTYLASSINSRHT